MTPWPIRVGLSRPGAHRPRRLASEVLEVSAWLLRLGYFTNTPTSQRLTPGNSSSIVVLMTSLMRNGTTPR
jgi:hypothetical protein